MTPKGFVSGSFLLGGLALTLYGFNRQPIIFIVGLAALLYGAVTLWRMRLRKIDPTK